MKHVVLALLIMLMINIQPNAQNTVLHGRVWAGDNVAERAWIKIAGTHMMVLTDSAGNFAFHQLKAGQYNIETGATGFRNIRKKIQLVAGKINYVELKITELAETSVMDEVVVSGTLKEVLRSESPIPVETYTNTFLKKNPAPTLFDALQNINGVRPQINCNVCNTGDIHINGLEGPYTMVLIDGMPVVSALSTVYGLSGIPAGLIDRVEIVKGPASLLYGSEAVGGVINVITKEVQKAPVFYADVFTTSWLETSADIGFKTTLKNKVNILTGLSGYFYNTPFDKNADNFTDVTLQKRISFFQKWSNHAEAKGKLNIAARFLYEDRWGGDMQWNSSFRGTDSIYGESIYTARYELLGSYALPVKEKLNIGFSVTSHHQNSYYGTTPFTARQNIFFGQMLWNKNIKKQDVLMGVAVRNTYYDDNTVGTADSTGRTNQPERVLMPGVFVQNESILNETTRLLAGVRLDYHRKHGPGLTPRLALKHSFTNNDVLRINAGTGFRVVNLFTEDHAALTGARNVVIASALKPEKSYNISLNYFKKKQSPAGWAFVWESGLFFTRFANRIVPDYTTNVQQIIYNNLQGYAISKGISSNLEIVSPARIRLMTGATLMENTIVDNNIKQRQLLTERFTATWALSVPVGYTGLSIDYTGNVYSPMLLPLLGDKDPRKSQSPWWSIQNLQLIYKTKNGIEYYAGVKNLLNFTVAKGNPFIIARSHDPFDKEVQFDTSGSVVPTPANPYGLTFDPTYVYAPNQGIRGFAGVRISIN